MPSQKKTLSEATFICHDTCTTCRKARRWLDENGIVYRIRPIREEKPTVGELRIWQKNSGLPLKRFFNTSGLLYRSMDIKNKLPEMTEEEQLSLLATDGMLVKRPILIDGGRVLVGFKEKEWASSLLPAAKTENP